MQLQACLDELGHGERQVLTYRAGLGPGPALSRTEVARRLDVGVAHAGRIERRGLRHLGRLDAAGACGSAGSSALLASLSSGSTPLAALGTADAGQATSAGGVGGVTSEGGPSKRSDGPSFPFSFGSPPGDSTLFVLLGFAVALALLLRHEMSRR